jgi:hypothetical protein
MQPFLLDRATRALRDRNIREYAIIKLFRAHRELLENQIEYGKEMVKLEAPIEDADAQEIVTLIRRATTHQEVSDTVIWTVPMLIYEAGDL